MPPDPLGPAAAIEVVLASEEDAVFAYKIAIMQTHAIADIRRCGEFLHGHTRAAHDLGRVLARLLAKQGTWGAKRARQPAGTGQRIGALTDDDAIFAVLARAEDAHTQKLLALYEGAEGLPRDVRGLLEKNLLEAEERRRWLHERTGGQRTIVGKRAAAGG